MVVLILDINITFVALELSFLELKSLRAATHTSREIIKEHSDDFNLANLNKKVIKLLVTNDKPAMLKNDIVVNKTN